MKTDLFLLLLWVVVGVGAAVVWVGAAVVVVVGAAVVNGLSINGSTTLMMTVLF